MSSGNKRKGDFVNLCKQLFNFHRHSLKHASARFIDQTTAIVNAAKTHTK